MRLQTEVSEWFGSGAVLPATGRVHFVGIGGAGMSALARILLRKGREVSGSDVADSRTIGQLRELGARVWLGHSAEHVDGASAIIVSDAIDLDDNPESKRARDSGVPLIRRSQLLGQIVDGKKVLAVTGSHGKSTATALLAQILEKAGMDPMAIVGADVPGFEGNVRYGEGDWAVVEACEAYDSFHDIRPTHVLLTNLEPEHLDYHGTWESLRDSVVRFVRSSNGGTLVYYGGDKGAKEVANTVGGGSPYNSGADTAVLFGDHNKLNARGAVEMAMLAGVDEKFALDAVKTAQGCSRRLEKIGEQGGVLVYDDYAHHPTEIAASIDALRAAHPGRRLLVVFQPHLYSRTKDQLAAFAPAFAAAGFVVVTDIYPAREKPIPGIASALIVQNLETQGTHCAYVPSRHWLPREVVRIAKPGDTVVGMGAGNIDAFAPAFMSELKRSEEPLKVAVFCGGDSAEREVSILSGSQVSAALERKGYDVSVIDPASLLIGRNDLSRLMRSERPDIVFLALHGTGAEDGAIQGLLELLRIPYTGAGIMASALAMDKEQTKRLLSSLGLQVAKGALVRSGDPTPAFAGPCVVKPNAQGSTIGLSFVSKAEDLPHAIETALKYDSAALVEEWIQGTEVSVPVLGSEALPVVEIVPRSGSYDFAAKYTPGETDEIVPARISETEAKMAKECALMAHDAVGALDFSRTDMMVRDGQVVVLEVNTLPGMTSTSLLPRSAEAAGIDYDTLCERILLSALNRYGIAKR